VLRALVLALLLTNLAFYAWTEGWLDSVIGARPTGDREPERLARQVHPDSVRILSPSEAVDVPAPIAPACLEAGPFADAELNAVQSVAKAALPAGSWESVNTDVPGVWIVYMGKYPAPDLLTKKEDELNRRSVQFEELLDHPTLAPGLSLGKFDDRTRANKALDDLAQQGIHTARVVELTPPSTIHLLRVEKADPALATRLASLTFNSGKGFVACANAPAR